MKKSLKWSPSKMIYAISQTQQQINKIIKSLLINKLNPLTPHKQFVILILFRNQTNLMKPFAIIKPQKQLYHYIDLKYRQKIPMLSVQGIKQPKSIPKQQPHVVTKEQQRWSNVHVVDRTFGKYAEPTSLARSSYKSEQLSDPIARKLDFSSYQTHRKPIFEHKRPLSVNNELKSNPQSRINADSYKKQDNLPQSKFILQNSQSKQNNQIQRKENNVLLVQSHLVQHTQHQPQHSERINQIDSQKSQNKSLVQSLDKDKDKNKNIDINKDKDKFQFKHVPIFSKHDNPNPINRVTYQDVSQKKNESSLLKQSNNLQQPNPINNQKDEVIIINNSQNNSNPEDTKNINIKHAQHDQTKLQKIREIHQNTENISNNKRNKPLIFSKQNKIYHNSLQKEPSSRMLMSPQENSHRLRIYSHLNEVKIQNELQKTQPRKKTSGPIRQSSLNIQEPDLSSYSNNKDRDRKEEMPTARKNSTHDDKLKNKIGHHWGDKVSENYSNDQHRFNTSQMSQVDKSSIYQILSSGSSIVLKSSPPYDHSNSLAQSLQLQNKSYKGQIVHPRSHLHHEHEAEPQFKKIIGIGKKSKHNASSISNTTPIRQLDSQIKEQKIESSLRSPPQVTVPKVLSLRPKGLKKSDEDSVRNSQSSTISIQVFQIEQMHPFRI